jgi:AraC-like DNA-binding protein
MAADTTGGWRTIGTGSGVRVATLRAVPDLLRAVGADPAEAFASAGLPPAGLDDAEGLVPTRAADRLIAECVRLTGLDDFGLRVGSRGGLGSVGIAGALCGEAPTVRSALRGLLDSYRLRNRATVPWMSVDGPIAALGLEVCEPGGRAREQIQDGSIALAFNVLRDVCGPDFRPVDVRLARRPPARGAAHFEHFGRRPTFDSPLNAIVFDARWLDGPVAGPARPRRAADAPRVEGPCAEDRRTLPQRVRIAVRSALVHRNCSAERVARVLSIGYRTLHRRLAESGTTFQEVVDSVRFDTAATLLAQTDLPLSEIADALDYADPSTFTRAFVRWTGSTPSAWRDAAIRSRPERASRRRP